LPVPAEHLGRAVSRQADDPASMMAHYRAALALRRAHPVLRTGTMTPLVAQADVVRFMRQDGVETLFCAVNLGDASADAALPDGVWTATGAGLDLAPVQGGTARLGPWQACLARRG
jgi:alpha-glucosidase